MPRKTTFDVVIYGATGFTGELVAEHLFKNYGDKLSWALAGRSMEKLAAVRDRLGAPPNTPLIEADATDTKSLLRMVSQTKAVLSTVGPYQIYGSPLVEVCAVSGTDYLDINAEPHWMRRMIDAFHQIAQTSGARILFSCGFDSIPSELGVLYLQDAAIQSFGEAATRIQCRVRNMKGGFSEGTIASLRANQAAGAADPFTASLLREPFALTPGFRGPEHPLPTEIAFDGDLNAWAAPYFMAYINTCNVHRSNFLRKHAYGMNFIYDEMLLTGPGEEGEVTARAIADLVSSPWQGNIPNPGEGPSRAEREAGFYDLLFVGLGKDNARLHVSVAGDRDPGYGSTSKIIMETYVCLSQDGEDVEGGIWTPGAALGQRLIHHLEATAGLAFRSESI